MKTLILQIKTNLTEFKEAFLYSIKKEPEKLTKEDIKEISLILIEKVSKQIKILKTINYKETYIEFKDILSYMKNKQYEKFTAEDYKDFFMYIKESFLLREKYCCRLRRS